jgi:hypothetical protein
MALVVPDVGEVILLTRIITTENSKLRLFSNDLTPDDDSVIASFTECSGNGYATITLTGSISAPTWSVATALGVTTASYAAQVFTMTGALTAYGYYVTDNAGTGLLWAERFTGAPFVIPAGGGTITVTLNITGA